MDPDQLAFTIVLITLIILILIAGITISFFAINRQKHVQKVMLTETQLSYEKELRKVEGELTDNLMLQIGQELHDNIGHLLTCLRLEIENIKLDDEQLGTRLGKADEYLQETSDQLRQLGRSLNSDYIKNLGLQKAIDLEIRRIEELNKFQIHWKNEELILGLTNDQELMLFRVFQEILNNALKYSKAANFYVSLQNTPMEFQLKDDGEGFDLEALEAKQTLSGIKNILNRCSIAGLECSIGTELGAGCTYTITKLENSNIDNDN